MYRGHCTNMRAFDGQHHTETWLDVPSFLESACTNNALLILHLLSVFCVCAGAIMKQIMTCWLLKDKSCGNNFSIIPARPKQAVSFPQNIVQSLTTYPKVRCVYTSAGWTVMNRNHTLWSSCLLLHSSIRLIVLLYCVQQRPTQAGSSTTNLNSILSVELKVSVWGLLLWWTPKTVYSHYRITHYIVVSLTVLRGKQFVTKLN